ncbi:hypothetical protein AwEntero_28320 [Enterobacterales bacterium]|nr:hypothetical protein AwEntero_28320 [Enterobacterales bacterium]
MSGVGKVNRRDVKYEQARSGCVFKGSFVGIEFQPSRQYLSDKVTPASCDFIAS